MSRNYPSAYLAAAPARAPLVLVRFASDDWAADVVHNYCTGINPVTHDGHDYTPAAFKYTPPRLQDDNPQATVAFGLRDSLPEIVAQNFVNMTMTITLYDSEHGELWKTELRCVSVNAAAESIKFRAGYANLLAAAGVRVNFNALHFPGLF